MFEKTWKRSQGNKRLYFFPGPKKTNFLPK